MDGVLPQILYGVFIGIVQLDRANELAWDTGNFFEVDTAASEVPDVQQQLAVIVVCALH
ncbi:hypothetical protein D3C81_1586730 [compost metagenome]